MKKITKIEQEVKVVEIEYTCECGGRMTTEKHYKNQGVKVLGCAKCGSKCDIPEGEAGIVYRKICEPKKEIVEAKEAKNRGLVTEW